MSKGTLFYLYEQYEKRKFCPLQGRTGYKTAFCILVRYGYAQIQNKGPQVKGGEKNQLSGNQSGKVYERFADKNRGGNGKNCEE